MIREDMMEHMSLEEFLGWMAYAEVEPFGDLREDLRAGVLWSLLATIHADPKKQPKGIGLDKYPLLMMREAAEKPPVTSQSLFRALKALSTSKRKPS